MKPILSLSGAVILLVAIPSIGSAQTAGDAKAGKQKYDTVGCTGCHGVSGKGDGPAAAALNPTKPRDFTDCSIMAGESDEIIFTIIKGGGQSAGRSLTMPAWRASLSDQDIRDLIAYIRSFCKK